MLLIMVLQWTINLTIIKGHLCNIFKNYHITSNELLNNLQPTRNLKARYLLQSRKIQTLTRQYDAGLLTTWQFIQTVSYSSKMIVNQEEDETNEPQADNQIIPQQNISVCIVCMYNTEKSIVNGT